MRIEVLPIATGNVIAREIKVQGPTGEFHLRLTGRVTYRSPRDNKEWPAGQSISDFTAAAQAWNKYCDEVANAKTDKEEIAIVDALRSGLAEMGLLQEDPTGYWSRLLTEAEDGLL